jgi:hypothetical protein
MRGSLKSSILRQAIGRKRFCVRSDRSGRRDLEAISLAGDRFAGYVDSGRSGFVW